MSPAMLLLLRFPIYVFDAFVIGFLTFRFGEALEFQYPDFDTPIANFATVGTLLCFILVVMIFGLLLVACYFFLVPSRPEDDEGLNQGANHFGRYIILFMIPLTAALEFVVTYVSLQDTVVNPFTQGGGQGGFSMSEA